MKKAIAIAVAFANAGTLYAQDAPEADYELVTTAIHQRQTETALPVTVVTGRELQESAAATLGGTLAGQPGINNASFGPGVGHPVIRGQQGRRVMSLNNGIPTADASGNSSDHAITTETILADSVEVLRGPSTLLYGGGAIGGVVNVIDNRVPSELPEAPELVMEARQNTASDQDSLVLRADGSAGPLAWHVDGLYREWDDLEIPGLAIDPRYLEHEEEHEEHEEPENTDGYVADTDGKTTSWTAGLSWVGENGHIGLSVNHLDNRYGLPAGAHVHAEEEHEEEEHEEEEHEHEEEPHAVYIDMQSTRYDLMGEWRNHDALFEKLDYRLSYTDYEHTEVEDDIAGTRFTNQSWQQRLQLTHRELSGWHGVLGLQSSYGEFAAQGEEAFIPVTDTVSNGLFLVEDLHSGMTTLELGARLNRDSYKPDDTAAPDRDFTTYSLSGSLLLDMSDWLTVGLSLSHSERAPSTEELYSNNGLAEIDDCVLHLATASCEVGNDQLSKERSLNTDLTFYLDLGGSHITVTAFHNEFDDYIYLANTGLEVHEAPVREYRQAGARFTGLELESTIPLSADWQLSLFGDVVDSHIKHYGTAPLMPPGRIGGELRFSPGNWSFRAGAIHAFEQDDPGPFELSTDAYTRIDVGADYTLSTNAGEFLFFIKGLNLGDEEIRLSTSYLRGFAPEAGRSAEMGVRYRF